MAVSLVVLLVLAGGGLGALYLSLRGQTIENSMLGEQVRSAIQGVVGNKLSIAMGPLSIAFDDRGRLSLVGRDVVISRREDGAVAARLSSVSAGVDVLASLSGVPQLGRIEISGAEVDAGLLLPPRRELPPVSGLLAGLGRALEGARTPFAQQRLTRLVLTDVTINGLPLGLREPAPLRIEEAILARQGGDGLTLTASLAAGREPIGLEGTWSRLEDGSRKARLAATGLDLRHWTRDAGDETPALLRTDIALDMTATAAFAPDGRPGPATIEIASEGGRLLVARAEEAGLAPMRLSLLADPVQEAILLQPSTVTVGEARGVVAGSMRALAEGGGLSGPQRLDLVLEDVRGRPARADETLVTGRLTGTGEWHPVERALRLSAIEGRFGEDAVTGTATVAFTGRTPAIAADLSAPRLSVAALHQFWPDFIAPGPRRWVERSILAGQALDVRLVADLPPDVVGRLHLGARMEPEQYRLTARVEGVTLRTFGEVPLLEDAAGEIELAGMGVRAGLASGIVDTGASGRATATAGSYAISNFADLTEKARVAVSLQGSARTLATIAQARPLAVMERIGVDPAGVDGTAEAEVTAIFRPQPRLSAADVDWRARVVLSRAAVAQPVFGHRIAAADLTIEAEPSGARIKGKAQIDGAPATIEVDEPIGAASTLVRRRHVEASLDERTRKRMGLDLAPVVRGPMKLVLDEKDGRRQVDVDLSAATLDLPWIGWSKGRGVPARLTFDLEEDGETRRLRDLYLEGRGFSVAGSLEFGKRGLVSADLADVHLNPDDSFSVRVKRAGRVIDVAVDGVRYDARSLLRKVFHETGFGAGDADSGVDVRVRGRLGSVLGFNDRVLEDVELSYATAGGWFNELRFRGSAKGGVAHVQAATKDKRTRFDVVADDAGGLAAFTDTYSKMRGGALRARLTRERSGPFKGPISITDFTLVDEPRLARLVASAPDTAQTGGQAASREGRAAFVEAKGMIEKGDGSLHVTDGLLRSNAFAFTFDGTAFDARNRMNLAGTFLPAIGLSRALGYIPLVGGLLGNGRDSGLLGITFKLSGPADGPKVDVNPVSLVAPGPFRKLFEFSQ